MGRGSAPTPRLPSVGTGLRPVCELSHADHFIACDGSGTSIVVAGASKDAFIRFPKWIMGIDKSLTDDFPSVMINGTKYH